MPARDYVLLAIGDGLVAQIPALVISMAAGMIVSRVGNDDNIGNQLVSQVFKNKNALTVTSVVLGLIGLVPGMPHFAFLVSVGDVRRACLFTYRKAGQSSTW